MVRSLYISVDMEKHISITSYPVDGFRSVGGHFGVVLIGQSNGEVTVHISWLGKTHLLNLWSSWWIPNCQKLWSCVFPCQLMCTVTSSCMMCTMTSPYDWPWKSTQKWLLTCQNPSTGSTIIAVLDTPVGNESESGSKIFCHFLDLQCLSPPAHVLSSSPFSQDSVE